MGTLPKHHHGTTRNAYPVECGYCGVPFPRNRMRKDASGLWVCPDEGKGRDRTLLDRLNARIKPFRGPRPADAPTHTYSSTPSAVGIYADSENGNDDFTGDSPYQPYYTLNKAVAHLHFGDTLYVARGSYWREQVILPNGVTMRAYTPPLTGATDRPTIDARNVASNADFNRDSTLTNTYSILWSLNTDDAGGKCRHRVWENGVMLTRVTSQALCNATAGTFYAPSPTSGPDTVYVHPFGNTNPRTDGKTYELTKRKYALNAYNYYLGNSLYSIDTIGAAHADGSTLIDGYAYDCTARDGCVHNMFVRGMAENCTATGIDQTVDYSLFITYMDTNSPGSTGRDVVFKNCTADAGTGAYTAFGTGYFVHTDNVRFWGTVQCEGCTAIGPDIAFSGLQAATFIYKSCTASLVKYGVEAEGVTRTVILGGFYKTQSADNQLIRYVAANPYTLILQGVKSYRVNGGQGPFYFNNALGTVIVQRCTFTSPIGTWDFLIAGSFTWKYNLTHGDNQTPVRLAQASAQVTHFDADFNNYHPAAGNPSFQKEFGGHVDYLTIADWHTYLVGVALGAGTEASSTQLDPQLADPVNGDFTIGNATLVAAGIGAEQDDDDDAALVALWNLYKVTITGFPT